MHAFINISFMKSDINQYINVKIKKIYHGMCHRLFSTIQELLIYVII